MRVNRIKFLAPALAMALLLNLAACSAASQPAAAPEEDAGAAPLSAAAAALAQAKKTTNYPVIDVTPTYADVEFAQVKNDDGNTKSLKMDIYRPENAGEKAPAGLYVHGGAWLIGNYKNQDTMSGEKNNGYMRALFSLMDQGVVIVNTGYRMSTEAIFPAQIYDVKGAIRFLKAHAEEYGIDPDRIAIAGVSAGAQLAILAAVTGDEEALEGRVGGNLEYSSRVAACVDLFGMTDFTTLSAGLYDTPWNISGLGTYELVDVPESSRSLLFGLGGEGEGLGVVLADLYKTDSPYRDKIELIKSASAINYVTSDDPPIFIANGGKDARVPVSQATSMHEALTRAGVKTYLVINSEAGHGDLGSMVNTAMVQFLRETLGV